MALDITVTEAISLIAIGLTVLGLIYSNAVARAREKELKATVAVEREAALELIRTRLTVLETKDNMVGWRGIDKRLTKLEGRVETWGDFLIRRAKAEMHERLEDEKG